MSPLKLNEDLGQLHAWTEKTIGERADKLIERAIELWLAPIPKISTSVTLSTGHSELVLGDATDAEEAEDED